MRARIQQELALLTPAHAGVQHVELNGEDWFMLPAYPMPEGWRLKEVAITATTAVFKLNPGYPNVEPYAFLLPAGINFNGQAPQSTSSVGGVPFPGQWLQFSWSPTENWTPAAIANEGSNMLAWARSFTHRLKEGA